MSPEPSSPGHGLLNKMTVQSGSAFFRIGFLPVFKVRQNSQIFMNVTTFQISFPRLLEATWRGKSVVVMETSFICTLPFISLQTNASFTLPRSMVATVLGFSVEWAGPVVVIYAVLVYYWGKDLHNSGTCSPCSSFHAFDILKWISNHWDPMFTLESGRVGGNLPSTTVLLQMFLLWKLFRDFSLQQSQATAMTNEFWLLCKGQVCTHDLELKDDLFSISPVLPPLCLSCLHWCFLYSLTKWQLHLFHSHFSLDFPKGLSGSVWLHCRWGSVPRNLFLVLKIKSLSCC